MRGRYYELGLAIYIASIFSNKACNTYPQDMFHNCRDLVLKRFNKGR